MVKPKHIIPAHADPEKANALVDLAHEMGYTNETIHHIQNSTKLVF